MPGQDLSAMERLRNETCLTLAAAILHGPENDDAHPPLAMENDKALIT